MNLKNLEALWESLDPKPWQIKEEFLPFLQFVLDNKIKKVLEIGTHKGGTASALLKLGCQVTSVDIVKQPEIEDLIKYQGLEFYFRDYMSELARIIPPGQHMYDLLFIDGGHTYEECKQDYLEFQHLVGQAVTQKKEGLYFSRCGFVFFHDTKKSALHEKQNCGVWKFIEELELEETFRAENSEEWGGLVGFNVWN